MGAAPPAALRWIDAGGRRRYWCGPMLLPSSHSHCLGSSPHVAGAKTLASGLEKTRLANEELISRLQSSLLKVKEELHEVHLTRLRSAGAPSAFLVVLLMMVLCTHFCRTTSCCMRRSLSAISSSAPSTPSSSHSRWFSRCALVIRWMRDSTPHPAHTSQHSNITHHTCTARRLPLTLVCV